MVAEDSHPKTEKEGVTMPTLYRNKGAEGRFPELLSKAGTGDLIAGLGKIDPAGLEIYPHPIYGVIQRVPDAETDFRFLANGKVVFASRGHAWPFGENFLVRLGRDFYLARPGKNHEEIWLPTMAGKPRFKIGRLNKLLAVKTHPDGVMVETEHRLLGHRFLLLTPEREKAITVFKNRRPPDEFQPVEGGIVWKTGRKFRFNREPIGEFDEADDWFALGGKRLVFAEKRQDGSCLLRRSDRNDGLIEVGPDDSFLVLSGPEKIVVWKDFRFSVNGQNLPREIPHDRIHSHPNGVLLERNGEFLLLVVK